MRSVAASRKNALLLLWPGGEVAGPAARPVPQSARALSLRSARVSSRERRGGSMMSAQAVLSAAPIAAVAAQRARASRAAPQRAAARRAAAAILPASAFTGSVLSRRNASATATRRVARSAGTAAAAAAHLGNPVVAMSDAKGERPVILVAEKLGKGGARTARVLLCRSAANTIPTRLPPGRREALIRASIAPRRAARDSHSVSRRYRPAEGLWHCGGGV